MADTNRAMQIPKELMDPNYVYTWGAEEPRSRVEMRLDGYVDVNVNDETGKLLKGHALEDKDGKIRLGDAVLMRVKREDWEKADKERVAKANDWVKKVREEYKAEGARLGIQAFEDSTP